MPHTLPKHQPGGSVLTRIAVHVYMYAQVAESAAAQEESRTTALTLQAEEAERKLAEFGHKRQRQLADITNLKYEPKLGL